MKATPIILIIGAGAVGYYFYNKNKTAKEKAEQPKPAVKKAPSKKAPAKKLAVKINQQNINKFKAIAKKYATKENVSKALKVLRKK